MCANETEWYNWKWQFGHRLRTKEDFAKVLTLTETEKSILANDEAFTIAVTPYFASLINQDDPDCPIRKQAIPTEQEMTKAPNGSPDPLNEEDMSPVPNLIHRYSDRALLIVTETCNMYCRHCTRRRRVGFKEKSIGSKELKEVLAYLEQNPNIRDVLISGGDPLTLSDQKLESIISQIKAVPHVEIIRIGTRAPVTNPYRVTAKLVNMLRKYHPIWVNVQFNHYHEITPAATKACEALADAGIPLGNQTVLLRGVNDTVAIQKKLAEELVKIRVRPYYIYQCDLAQGLEHFRTATALGIEIIENLQGHISGFAVPTFVIDAPEGGGKIPVSPEYVLCKTTDKIVLRNYEGRIFTYPEPDIK